MIIFLTECPIELIRKKHPDLLKDILCWKKKAQTKRYFEEDIKKKGSKTSTKTSTCNCWIALAEDDKGTTTTMFCESPSRSIYHVGSAESEEEMSKIFCEMRTVSPHNLEEEITQRLISAINEITTETFEGKEKSPE